MPPRKKKVAKKVAIKKTPKKRTPKQKPTAPKPISAAQLITKEFRNSEAFSKHIIEESQRRSLTAMDTLLEYCTDKNIDPPAVAGLLTKELKALIEVWANNLNLLK